jgi:molecular chaperone DnaK
VISPATVGSGTVSSGVISSGGADGVAASGEIKSAPPTDPSAASAVLLETHKAIDRPIVAMDFGTTRSSVALLMDDKLEPNSLPRVAVLKLPDGQWDMPTTIGFRPNGAVVLGDAARRMLATDPANAVMSPKRLLGRKFDDPQIQPLLANTAMESSAGPQGQVVLHARGKDFSVTEACAHILNLLKLVAQRNLKQDVSEVVLSIPVSFSEPQHAALEQAATMAGLKVAAFVDEPVAAAFSNRYDPDFKGLVAVYDFGGGTFDFTVVEVLENDLKVISRGGDAWLGGDDIDSALASAAANAFWRDTGIELRNQATQWQQLLIEAEQAKRRLSKETKTRLHLKEAALTPNGPLDINLPITRAQFAGLCREIIQRSMETCQTAMKKANVRRSDLSAVFVSGGTSHIPAVQQAIVEWFSKVPRSGVPPERAVLVGAALQRAYIDD